MVLKKFAALLLLINSSVVMAQSDKITVVGYTNETDEIVQVVPKRLLKKKTAKMLKMMNDAGHNGLEKAAVGKKGNWELQSIEIGPGVNASIGIGKWQIGGIAGFKLMFERQ